MLSTKLCSSFVLYKYNNSSCCSYCCDDITKRTCSHTCWSGLVVEFEFDNYFSGSPVWYSVWNSINLEFNSILLSSIHVCRSGVCLSGFMLLLETLMDVTFKT